MRRAILPILILAAVPALAQQKLDMPSEPPGLPILERATAGTYKIDSDHSQVLFTVDHLGFSEYTGMFTSPAGTLVLDLQDDTKSKVDVSFPIVGVETTVPELDAHLKSADFFDAAKYPTAHFVSTEVQMQNTSALIVGNLTIKGHTQSFIMKADFIGAGDSPVAPHKVNIGFTATGHLNRSDYGIGYGVPLVSDRVELTIHAAFAHE
jgi:polyisoprenoid-binding protein YceI